MKNTLNPLHALWQKDKEYYRTTEVGTGVQSFVKQVFESELFDLREGNLSAKLENRKNEFIYEKKAKEKRKADFYIYINSEIAIPVEVECYGNIKTGESQLFNYQKDFDKHYGILTDGYTWRFYNNNIFKVFTLEDLLTNTQLFLTFWKEYVKPEFYYLSFFEKTGQLALIEETKLRVENNRQLFFEDITKLIQSFKNKLQIEGYLEASNDKERGKRAIELTYAYVIQFILYKTLVDNDFDDFANEFETIVKRIHESLKVGRYKDILGIIEGISARISKNIYRPFIKEQEFIKDKILELYHSLENNLSDISPWLDIFIFIKKYNYANVRNEIFGYIYENYLKELYDESKKGQYFTDPAVVNFMLEQVGFTPETVSKRYELDKDSISIIDPSCGSGTFLYSATDVIVKGFKNGSEEASKKIEEAVTNGIFGLDIEEFPLYLAEMSILMRMLSLIINEKYNNPIDKKIKVFKTNDSISEFMDTALKNTVNDIDIAYQKSKGQMGLFTEKLNLGYSSYVRDEDDLKEMKTSLENHTETLRKRFDYVIGNPPYIRYNDCIKQRLLSFELMKNKKAKLSDIYGVNLHSTPENKKKYAPKPNLFAFFIALGLALLKDKGKLCYIIPQTILINPDFDVLRYHLSRFTTIKKIIIFSGKMFIGRGLKSNKPIPTSSLIFIVSREIPAIIHRVEILKYKDKNDDIDTCLKNISHGKKVIKKLVLQNKLLQNVGNWNFIKFNIITECLYEEYIRNSIGIAIYSDHVLSSVEFGNKFYFDGGALIDEKYITNSVDDYYEIVDELDEVNYLVPKGKRYYPSNKKINFPQGSQGIQTFKQENKLIWRTKNTKNFCFTNRKILLETNKYMTISSDNKQEIFYLFALLNSKVTKWILKNVASAENEDTNKILVSLKVIKDLIRPPIIGKNNESIKKESIKRVEEVLALKDKTILSFVDLSKIMIQKFDRVYVENRKLVMEKEGEKIRLPIKRNSSLVSKVIEANYNKEGLGLDKKIIALSELMSLPVIDFDKQQAIKNHIDDLVFCLYFNIDIPKDKVSDTSFVKSACVKNKYYTRI
ncbi:MAG: N-6 DNA methylase [Candidatus Shapirobacteria bacterium]